MFGAYNGRNLVNIVTKMRTTALLDVNDLLLNLFDGSVLETRKINSVKLNSRLF